MRRFAQTILALAFTATTSIALADMKPGQCTFSDAEKVKKHAAEHIKYPATGKDVKAACKKQWPDEFSKAEWACFDASVKDDKSYASAGDVLKAVGVK